MHHHQPTTRLLPERVKSQTKIYKQISRHSSRAIDGFQSIDTPSPLPPFPFGMIHPPRLNPPNPQRPVGATDALKRRILAR